MKVIKPIVTLVVLGLIALAVWHWWSAGRLSADEKAIWESFLQTHMSNREQPSDADINAVAAIGDKIVPYVQQTLGRAAPWPAMKSDISLTMVLARIGTPRAVEAILEVVRHDYPGHIGRDREVAAGALVWLGAKQGIPVLEAAIENHRQLVAEELAREPSPMKEFMCGEEIKKLEEYLRQLKAGEGMRDTKNFPYD